MGCWVSSTHQALLGHTQGAQKAAAALCIEAEDGISKFDISEVIIPSMPLFFMMLNEMREQDRLLQKQPASLPALLPPKMASAAPAPPPKIQGQQQ